MVFFVRKPDTSITLIFTNDQRLDIELQCTDVLNGSAEVQIESLSTSSLTIPLQIRDYAANGVFECSLNASVGSRPAWSMNTSYVYDMPLTLYYGCWTRVPEAYLIQDEESWLTEPIEQQKELLEIYVGQWRRASDGWFSVDVHFEVRNGGNATGNITSTITCDDNLEFSQPAFSFSTDVEAGMTRGVIININAKGTATSGLHSKCTLMLSIVSETCWSPIGKQYTQDFDLPMPNDPCLNLTSTDLEPALFVPLSRWQQAQVEPLNQLMTISLTDQLSCNDQACVVVSTTLYNAGTATGIAAAEVNCLTEGITVLNSSQTCTLQPSGSCKVEYVKNTHLHKQYSFLTNIHTS